MEWNSITFISSAVFHSFLQACSHLFMVLIVFCTHYFLSVLYTYLHKSMSSSSAILDGKHIVQVCIYYFDVVDLKKGKKPILLQRLSTKE